MDILKIVAGYVETITNIVPAKIILARKNYLNSDFKDSIAVVDNLIITPIGRSNNFNGADEKLTYTVRNKMSVTIDFYGDDALSNGNKFVARLNSQAGYEYTRDNNIEVFHNTTLTNIKNLQGKTVYNRYQIEIMVKYSEQFTDDVLRIDTLQYQVYTNN